MQRVAPEFSSQKSEVRIMKNIPEKITSIESLFGTLPNGIGLEDVRMERLTR